MKKTKQKGFVKILEVILAISLIFVVINNIYSAIPPRYQDTQNIYRLNRYAGDIASSICYNKIFKEDLIKGFIPINLTLRADAWNKSAGTETWDTASNIEATIRQTTYLNRSASVIKICIKTADATAEMNTSICEKKDNTNCKAGTLSSKNTIPASSTAGTICSNWFNYSINKNKVYLIIAYSKDEDYFIYYTSGINGPYNKTGVDETQLETGEGYTDYSNYPYSFSIKGYYDLGLNKTLAPDLNYHIWLYSNNTANGKLDDLINESGENTNSTIATSSCLISSYEKTYSPKKVVVGIWNRKN